MTTSLKPNSTCSPPNALVSCRCSVGKCFRSVPLRRSFRGVFRSSNFGGVRAAAAGPEVHRPVKASDDVSRLPPKWTIPQLHLQDTRWLPAFAVEASAESHLPRMPLEHIAQQLAGCAASGCLTTPMHSR